MLAHQKRFQDKWVNLTCLICSQPYLTRRTQPDKTCHKLTCKGRHQSNMQKAARVRSKAKK